VLLALGTATGGAWAELSWGRFWGWDPKEVWALITLLCYLAVLHARHVAWVGTFGLAALSVICFSVVVVTWYGVNYVLGTGLHTYGKGSGGESLMFALLFFQYAFVAAAAMRSAGHVRVDAR
jgi:ABC-type transport system involved in cytochrome c biogenesis permease subunit